MTDVGWFTVSGEPGPVLVDCMTAATAAPSVRNTQPWLFRVHDGTIDVFADDRRRLHALDPEGREMYVSVGAAVFTLRVALAAAGRASVARLLPEPDVAARVTIGPPTEPSRVARALAGAIGRRHTNRGRFADRPIPHRTWEELSAAAVAEGASLLGVGPALRIGVLGLIRTADTRTRGAHLAMGGLGPGHAEPAALVDIAPDPTLVMLATPDDTVADWLKAGAALQRLWLTATLRGLAATPMSQLAEISALRGLLSGSTTRYAAQTVLRLGYPLSPALATPRRPLAEVLLRPIAREPT